MRYIYVAVITGCLPVISLGISCASTSEFKKNAEPSSSAIKVAEDVGASKNPSASFYLQLAKEEMEQAKELAAAGKKNQGSSLLRRAEADAQLAGALAEESNEKNQAADAIGRVNQLKEEHQFNENEKEVNESPEPEEGSKL